MAKIKKGGQLESLKNSKVLEEVTVHTEDKTIMLWLNGSSVSYLSLDEAIALRNEINQALKSAVGV